MPARRTSLGLASMAATVATVLAAVTAAAPSSAATAPPSPEPGIAPASTGIGTSLAPVTVLAYTATGGSVWLKDLSTGADVSAGGHLISAPSIMTTNGTELIVSGRGTDSALWVTTCTVSGGCGAWSSLGGNITSRPGAGLENGGTDYVIFARGADGALWGRHYTSTSGWGPWTSSGGHLLSGTGPSIANQDWPDPDVLVVGTNKALYYNVDGVGGFYSIGGQTTASPALTTVYAIDGSGQADAQVVAFARGTDGAAWYDLFLSNSEGWHSMGGDFTGGLSASTAVAANIKSNVPTSTFGLTPSGQLDESDGTWSAYPPTFTAWKPVG